MSEERRQQITDFLKRSGFGDAATRALPGDASFRRYLRVASRGRDAMLMDAPPGREDVRPYLAMARYLYANGYSAPEIYAESPELGFVLLEDLGDDSFSAVLRANPARERELYEAAVGLLAQWQDGKTNLAVPPDWNMPLYDTPLLLKETSLFCEWYLRDTGAPAAEYQAVWESILAQTPLTTDCWVHRDYHADNLMWLPHRLDAKCVGLLDFQDAVWGDPAYDLASLLEDARRDVPPALAKALLARYLEQTGANKARFMTAYAVLATQRNSKIIGIFSRLAARDGKPAYLQFLPRVWRYLEHDLSHPALAPLKAWLDRHVPQSRRVA